MAIDGKALRGIHGDRLPGVHLMAAYAHQAGVVVGQQAVGEQKNPRWMRLPCLLVQWDLKGLVVTGDAQFTPAGRVSAGGGARGHYFFAVKGNSEHLATGHHGHLRDRNGRRTPEAMQVDQHGGRVEHRRLGVSAVLVGYSYWPHQTTGMLNGVRCPHQELHPSRTGLCRNQPAAPGSQPLKGSLALWRGHWGIEIRVHWVRDVTFDEDRSQVRTGSAPQVMAARRNLTVSLFRLAGEPRIRGLPYAVSPSTHHVR